jgi:hypothetical protein
VRRSWISSLGLLLGAVALVVAAVQHVAGPFDREPPIQEVVADKAKSLYETLRGQFADEETAPPIAAEPQAAATRSGIDRRLRAVTAAFGAIAVALAFAGFARREDPRTCAGAAVLGVAALPLVLSLGVLLAALMVSLAWRLLPNADVASGRGIVAAQERDQTRL